MAIFIGGGSCLTNVSCHFLHSLARQVNQLSTVMLVIVLLSYESIEHAF